MLCLLQQTDPVTQKLQLAYSQGILSVSSLLLYMKPTCSLGILFCCEDFMPWQKLWELVGMLISNSGLTHGNLSTLKQDAPLKHGAPPCHPHTQDSARHSSSFVQARRGEQNLHMKYSSISTTSQTSSSCIIQAAGSPQSSALERKIQGAASEILKVEGK